MKLFNNIYKYLSQFVGLFPSKIPTGMDEFDKWSNSIMTTYNLPTKNEEDIKFVLTTTIMHLGPTVAYKPKFYFVLVIKTAAAKQVASAQFQQIKLAQQKRAAEATAKEVVANESQQ